MNIGQQLKEARERFRITVREAAEETKIPAHFIEAFEAWDFSKLGALVYARGFFRRYASFLGASSGELQDEFERHWKETCATPEAEVILKQVSATRPIMNEKVLAVVGGSLVLLFLFAYLFYSVRGTFFSPDLVIAHPGTDFVTEVPMIDVEGRVESETDVSVSGRPLYVDEEGKFKERFYLSAGINALEFEAKSKFGKVTKVTRYVLLKQ